MTKKVIVNIRGCNGAGKSTIPVSMMDDEGMFVQSYDWNGKEKELLTVFPTYGWVALGTYFTKTGGCDRFSDKAMTEYALRRALEDYPEYDIILEGILLSTVFSTYGELFKALEDEFDRTAIIMTLTTPLEVCIERIHQRNGGKEFNEKKVEDKVGMVMRSHEKYKAIGLKAIKIDPSKISKDKLLGKFFKTIDKYRGD